MVPLADAFSEEDHLQFLSGQLGDFDGDQGSDFEQEQQETRQQSQAATPRDDPDVSMLDALAGLPFEGLKGLDESMIVDVPRASMSPSKPPPKKRGPKPKNKQRENVDEYEIETLDRLIQSLRASTPTIEGSDTVWDGTIEEELLEMEASLLPTGKRAKRRRTMGVSISLHQLSEELRNLLGQANMAYVAAENVKAIGLLEDVVELAPNCFEPWATLSQIYYEIDQPRKSLQCKVIAGLLQPRNLEHWKETARMSREYGMISQAILCYTWASKNNKDDVDVLWDRAVLLRDLGNLKGAAATLKQVLRILPNDPAIIRQLILDYMAVNDTTAAVTIGTSLFAHQRAEHPNGPPLESDNAYTIDDLAILTELLTGLRRYADAVRTVRVGQRWIQGRDDETFWDSFSDDREYDVKRENGRMAPPEHAEAGEETHPLDVRLRLALGQCRLAGSSRDKKEGKRHFDALMQDLQVEDDPQRFGDIADAYFERRMWPEAYSIYEKMSQVELIAQPFIFAKMAQCMKRLGRNDEAIELYIFVLDNDEQDYESKLQLAEIYELTGQRDAALEQLNAVLEARGDREVDDIDLSGFASAQRRAAAVRQRTLGAQTAVSRAQRLEMERQMLEEIQRAFQLLKENEAAMLRGEERSAREWSDIASFLVDNFRESKLMFPSDLGRFRSTKHALARAPVKTSRTQADIDALADDLASRIQRSMAQDEEEDVDSEVDIDNFRNISLDLWLKAAIQYCFYLARSGSYEEAIEILQHLQTSIMRLRNHRTQGLRLALAAVACHQNNYALAVDEVRKFLLAHPYQNPALRLMQAVAPSGLAAAQIASSSIHQKFIMRQLKIIESHVVKHEEATGQSKGRRRAVDDDDEDDAPAAGKGKKRQARAKSTTPVDGAWTPTRGNAAYMAHYGNIMGGSKSYQAAIIYYLRAYEMAPNNALICLCLGVQYFQRAMQRQSDNRHHQISQGLAFFGRYRTLRGDCQEVQYNLGRAYHGIGLIDGAISFYKRVLDMEEQHVGSGQMDVDGTVKPKSFARDAAYNLSLIYNTTGCRALAKKVARKWLQF